MDQNLWVKKYHFWPKWAFSGILSPKKFPGEVTSTIFITICLRIWGSFRKCNKRNLLKILDFTRSRFCQSGQTIFYSPR